MKKKIGVLNLKISNICSLQNSLKFIGCKFQTVDQSANIEKFEKLIIPGVGTLPESIKKIKKSNLDIKLTNFLKKKKILGICLGMQIFSNEGLEVRKTKGLGVYKEKVKRLEFLDKLPNIGFKKVKIMNKNYNFKNINNLSEFYFMHSYGITNIRKDYVESILEINGKKIISSIIVKNFHGVQFHPEKSRDNGLKYLNNFLNE